MLKAYIVASRWAQDEVIKSYNQKTKGVYPKKCSKIGLNALKIFFSTNCCVLYYLLYLSWCFLARLSFNIFENHRLRPPALLWQRDDHWSQSRSVFIRMGYFKKMIGIQQQGSFSFLMSLHSKKMKKIELIKNKKRWANATSVQSIRGPLVGVFIRYTIKAVV